MRSATYFLCLTLATVTGLVLLRFVGLHFDLRQIASVAVFSCFIYGTLLFGEFRLAFAFGGVAVLMAGGLLTVERFTQSASLDVIIFLIGTFLVIGFLEEDEFFEHVVNGIVRFVGPRPQRLLFSLMILASISSALVGEVTAILFMAGAMLHLTSRYKLNPVPFIIMLVFACNIGSAMSSVGNPIGVLIALKTGLSFVDFLKWSAPTALVVGIATFAICRWWFAAAFHEFSGAVLAEFTSTSGQQAGHTSDADYSSMGPGSSKTHVASWAVLGGLVLMLATHGWSERMLGQAFSIVRDRLPDGTIVYGLREGTMMVATALVMGCLVLLLKRDRARELVERRVDWWTLAFFMMLFASVGTLEDTKVTEVIAQGLAGAGASQAETIQIVGWATGWLSAFLDNVLAVATFMPVVHDIRASAPGPYSSGIYWFMLFGGTFMGNMTIIGSTANIVAVGLLEKRGHGTVRFGYWMKIGFIVSIASMLLASLLLQLQSRWIPVMPHPDTAGAH
jgi:Na+/H+ antiporter NhaD/arsenite permease-like protein